MLAGFQRRDRHFGMQIRRRGNMDSIDAWILHHAPPIGICPLNPIAPRGLGHRLFIPTSVCDDAPQSRIMKSFGAERAEASIADNTDSENGIHTP